MGKIALLGEDLINKIAAGEVVERPASVVKELCENALDAGAKTVRIALRGGGLEGIRVTDDGCGMSPEDALLALSRHATSKLKDLEGLFSISTLGFRGEALPAIASVSRFSLLTAEPGSACGAEVQKEGSADPILSDAAPVPGTQVCVEDLFFNTPARRKFLRKTETELRHCVDAVIRMALAHPEVGFFLEHGGKSLLACPRAKPVERIHAAVEGAAEASMLPVEERRLGLSVSGHVGPPELSLPSSRNVFIFVNRRYIRDRGIQHAVVRAFSDLLPPGRYPLAVLFLEVDPRAVDVNVHPQKLEVRFSDARGAFDAVYAAVARALGESGAWRTAPFSLDSTTPNYSFAVQEFLSRAQQAHSGAPLPAAHDGPSLLGQPRPTINEAPPLRYFSGLRYVGTLRQRYWICEDSGGTLVVVDPHAAQERVRGSALRREFQKKGALVPEPLLFSVSVALPPPLLVQLLGAEAALRKLGIEAEPFGGDTLAVKALPKGFAGVDPRRLLADLAARMPGPKTSHAEAWEDALTLMACHVAEDAEREPNPGFAQGLLASLDDADFRHPCAHSRVVLAELPFLELQRRAGG